MRDGDAAIDERALPPVAPANCRTLQNANIQPPTDGATSRGIDQEATPGHVLGGCTCRSMACCSIAGCSTASNAGASKGVCMPLFLRAAATRAALALEQAQRST